MKSGFVELIVKNRLAGKSLPLSTAQKKYEPVDSFKKYMNSILPKIQQSVEIQLLKKNIAQIQSPLIRKELINSYLRRLYRLRFYQQDEIKSYKELPKAKPQEVITFIDPTILKTINQHTYFDVGSYIIFSNEDFKTVFKNKSFGIFDKEHQFTKKFSIMIRKQSIGITNVMKSIQNAKAVYWEDIYALSPQQRLEYINDQHRYPVLFQEVSNYIYSKIKSFKGKQNYMRIWGNSIISDTLVNSILQNLDHVNDVFDMADQAIEQVMAVDIEPSANDFTKRFKQLPTNPPLKIFKNVPEFASYNYKTPSFKSVFLGGLGGTGRSMILAYVAMYAFKNNWILIHTPNIMKWAHDKDVTPQKMFNGLFVVQEHVLEWLDEFKTVNQRLLKDMKVNLQIYGKMDLTGKHEDQYQPVPNIYYQERQTYFNDINKRFQERIQMDIDTRPKWRMTDKSPKPANLLEILEAGLKNPAYSTCAMAQLLLQIYQSDKLVAEIVDDYSWLYRPTSYRNYKYYNDRDLFGKIPPYHIAHIRFFMNLDGHKLKRGIKVVASSIGILYKHHFDIKKIMLPEEYQHKVPNLTPQEFIKAARYNILTQNWAADQIQRKSPFYMYTLCQGNWVDFLRVAELGHYY